MRAVGSASTCLICGVAKAYVTRVRATEGYTVGCGVESNTESGFDYEELSPRHRWAPWTDRQLTAMGIKPEAFDRYRTHPSGDIAYAACEDTVTGHNRAETAFPDFGMKAGECWGCGKIVPAAAPPTESEAGC